MKEKVGLEPRKSMPLTATCINIMARFVQVSRQSGEQNLQLHDKEIITKINEIAQNTSNKQLQILHKRLCDELENQNVASVSHATQSPPRGDKFDLRSMWREWTQSSK